jgi:hypothetical protein
MSRPQSRKVREFLARKKLEEESVIKQQLEDLENCNLDDNTVNMSLQLFYDITIKKCNEYLIGNETIPVIRILKKLLEDGYNIDYIIIHLLACGTVLFYQFIKQIRRDLLNHLEAYDEIVRFNKHEEIINLLKYDIIELEHACKINKLDSLEHTIYMFMQLTDYENNINEYLCNRYKGITNEEGLFRHQVLYNVPHEIAVYIKSLAGNALNEHLINFRKIWKSYMIMEVNFSGSSMLKGRLVNLVRMICIGVLDKGFKLPSRQEFEKHFNKICIFKGAEKPPLFLEQLIWDIHWFIDTSIIQERANKLFPYEGDNGQWA